MKPRVTISTLAAACGVSKAAVSHALRGSGQVSAELGQTIREKAVELGYIPSRAARQLNGHHTPRVGIVLPLPGTPMESHILQALDEVCRGAGVETEIRYHYWHLETERRALRSLLDDGVTGLVLVPAHSETSAELCRLQEAGLSAPIVTVGALNSDGETLRAYLGNFAPDYRTIAPLCLRHVVEAGHRDVAVLFQGPYTIAGGAASLAQSFLSTAGSQSNLRIEMFYLDDSSSPIRRKILSGAPCTFEDVWETDNQLAVHFLDHPFEATVAVTSDDLTALSLFNECQRRSIKVPEELSIFSMGGSPVCRMFPLPVTHAKPDIKKLATRIMAKLLGDATPDHEEIAYPLSIVAGATLAQRTTKDSLQALEGTHRLQNDPITALRSHKPPILIS